MTQERPNFIPLDLNATRASWMQEPAFAEAYEALEDEFAALGELLRARRQAGMTQADVAESMGIAQASVARLESSAGSRKHAPSIATLRRYADAVGCDLHITLRPSAGRMRASAANPRRLAMRKSARPVKPRKAAAKKAAPKKAAAKKAAKRAGKAKRPAANQRGFTMKRAASKPARGQRSRA